jgi:hypothetical protein
MLQSAYWFRCDLCRRDTRTDDKVSAAFERLEACGWKHFTTASETHEVCFECANDKTDEELLRQCKEKKERKDAANQGK